MRARWLFVGTLLAAVTAPVGWVVSDRIEQDNDFCVSCHLSEGVQLHRDKRASFDARPAASLVAAHASAGYAEREADPAFRCIDCHGGTGLMGRVRVKILSAKDAFWYVVGRFDEPETMRWPLRDEDCSKCHRSFEETPGEEVGPNPRFHELAVHNVELGMACVACHASHSDAGLAEYQFLEPDRVRAQCADCHVEFASF